MEMIDQFFVFHYKGCKLAKRLQRALLKFHKKNYWISFTKKHVRFFKNKENISIQFIYI